MVLDGSMASLLSCTPLLGASHASEVKSTSSWKSEIGLAPCLGIEIFFQTLTPTLKGEELRDGLKLGSCATHPRPSS
jgi:hypothetical protein